MQRRKSACYKTSCASLSPSRKFKRSANTSPSKPSTWTPPCIACSPTADVRRPAAGTARGTCAHWLSWRVGWDLGTAREHLRVARALHTLPLVSEALSAGQISYSKTRAITRVASPPPPKRCCWATRSTAPPASSRPCAARSASWGRTPPAEPHARTTASATWRIRRRPLAWCASRLACAPTRPRCCFRCCSKPR
ncbi:MAG: DUF222 domain-containing protein [Myxococcales bacterium]|nr:DUF222 domain-containing protein [Myxococcales bacterium]